MYIRLAIGRSKSPSTETARPKTYGRIFHCPTSIGEHVFIETASQEGKAEKGNVFFFGGNSLGGNGRNHKRVTVPLESHGTFRESLESLYH